MIPIGAVVRQLEKSLPVKGDMLSKDEETRRARVIYDGFDGKNKYRPDYRLWRRRIFPYYAHGRPGLIPPSTRFSRLWNDWPRDAWECVNSTHPVLFWSAVALAPDMMHRASIMRHSRETAPTMAFVDDLYQRLIAGMPPLKQCPASCGMAAAIFLVERQQMLTGMGYWLGLRECQQLFRQLETSLGMVDPYWQPGAMIRTWRSEEERDGPARLRVSHDAYEYTTLVRTLMKCRPLISSNIFDWNSDAQSLFDDAYGYAKTAWLTARSRRFDEVRHLSGKNLSNEAANRKIRWALETEFRGLRDLAVAAREAGEYLESAKYLFLLLRLLPDELAADPEFRSRISSRIYRVIKEAGLEVDARFRTSTSDEQFYEEQARATLEGDSSWRPFNLPEESGEDLRDGELLSQSLRLARGKLIPRGFELRVIHDQSCNPDWSIVLSQVPLERRTGERFLHDAIRGLADARRSASPEVLEAAFKLAIRYGLIRSAGKLLERGVRGNEWAITEDRLMDFVQSVKRSTQLDPFGLDYEKLTKWHSLIRECCASLATKGVDWITPHNRLWLHELLLSRTHVQFRALRATNAWRLYDKAVGAYDARGLREFYDREYDFSRRAPGIATRETVAQYCEKRRDDVLGAPVAISVAVFGSVISAIAIGSHGIAAEQLSSIGLSEQFDHLIAESSYWFQVDGAPDRQVSWPPLFREFGAMLSRLMRACDPSARVMLLSIEPYLAQLPWQNLIVEQGEKTADLVALVPNFSTLTLPRRETIPGRNFVLSRENTAEIVQVTEAVQRSFNALDRAGVSLGVVVAHGERSRPGRLPALRVGPGRADLIKSSNDWIDLLGSRVVLLYCCHSGITEPLYMQEFGGIPGLALSVGTEVFIAPVSEVFPEAAVTLHEHLMRGLDSAPIGLGYVKAVATDSQCSLFNLYGDPYQRLVQISNWLAQTESRHSPAHFEAA